MIKLVLVGCTSGVLVAKKIRMGFCFVIHRVVLSEIQKRDAGLDLDLDLDLWPF